MENRCSNPCYIQSDPSDLLSLRLPARFCWPFSRSSRIFQGSSRRRILSEGKNASKACFVRIFGMAKVSKAISRSRSRLLFRSLPPHPACLFEYQISFIIPFCYGKDKFFSSISSKTFLSLIGQSFHIHHQLESIISIPYLITSCITLKKSYISL